MKNHRGLACAWTLLGCGWIGSLQAGVPEVHGPWRRIDSWAPRAATPSCPDTRPLPVSAVVEGQALTSNLVPRNEPLYVAQTVIRGMPAPKIVLEEDLKADRVNEFEVVMESALVLRMDDSSAWKASGYDSEIVGFAPGGPHGTYTTNPGFDPKRVGVTAAVVSDGKRSFKLKIRVMPRPE